MDRWEGIVRGCLFGSSLPARVMASLLLCPRSRTLRKPSKNAVLFMGDCVQATGNPTIDRISRLETVSSILLSKLVDPLVNVWVVEASRFNGPFACYEGFLPSMSLQGEPLSFKPNNFPASRATSSLLRSCLVEVNMQLEADDERCWEESKGGKQVHCIEETQHSIPETLLFGFSKGGVVLNQLLSEMSYAAAKHGPNIADDMKDKGPLQMYTSESKLGSPEHGLLPSTICEFLASIVAVHYVDVGLNSRGAYQTDASILEHVVQAAAASSSGLHLGFHGTPRQWNDPQRPWIASEKDECIHQLRKIARRDNMSKLSISEKLYFEHQKPSLQMHFEILERFQPD